MKPVRLAISLFVIELFIIFWIWLRYDDSFNPKAFVAIACISAVVFIAITTIITLFPKKTGLMQNQVFKGMPRPEDFLPGKPAQDKDATDGDSMDEMTFAQPQHTEEKSAYEQLAGWLTRLRHRL